MKEPLYRGKRIDNDEWVYGWYAPLVCNDRIVIPSIKDSNGSDWRVKRETVGQFTGLTDKNGKNIFEGDIIKVTDNYSDTYFTDVTAYGSTLCVDVEGVDYDFTAIDFAVDSWAAQGGDYEAIGNIYDNEEAEAK